MDFILSVIKTLSAISIITAALWVIMPRGALEGSFKYAMGIFALSAVISVIITSPADFTVNLNSEKVDTAILANTNNINTNTLQFAIEKLLYDEGIDFKKVEIITDKNGTGSIEITKAIIYTKNITDLEKAKAIIKNETGILAVGG